MGIFSDRCEALVDRETGKCLSGEALKEAKRDRKWPRCGARVKKAAKFCSKCGSHAPGGWIKCSACGKWVGNESQFCWSCNQALYPEDRAAVSGGIWQKEPGVLAKRVDVGDIVDTLRNKKQIIIEEGAAAILLQGGSFKDVLRAGEHTLKSLAHKINHWGDPPPRTVVLVDSGDVILAIRAEDLRTSEDIPVELYCEAIVRLAPSDKAGKAFMENVMKNTRDLTYPAFTEILKGELRQAILDVCNTGTIEDLFKDPQRHLHIENALEAKLKQSEERYGFELIRVSSAEFTGQAYEGLRASNGEVEIKRRQLEFDHRMREIVAKGHMSEFKTQDDLDAYVLQLAHEKEVSAEHRDHELALLHMVQRQEIDKKEALFAMQMAIDRATHEMGIKLIGDDYARSKLVKDAEAEAAETGIWLKVKAEKEKLRVKALEDEMNVYKGQDMKTLLAILPEDKRDALLKFSQQDSLKNMKSDEILALAAKDNPEIARMFLENARAQSQDRSKDWEERKKLLDESADRLERIMTRALEATSEAAKGKSGGDTNIIK